MQKLLITLFLFTMATRAVGQSTGAIEGDVYLLTQGGDIKKGAATTVGLVPRTRVKGGWDSMCLRYDAVWTASSKRDSVERSAVSDPSERLAVSRRILARIDSLLIETNELKIKNMIKLGVSTPTGMNAHYRFGAVKPGRYVLFSSMRLAGKLMTWVVPVMIRPGARSMFDLDNNNVQEGAPPCGEELSID